MISDMESKLVDVVVMESKLDEVVDISMTVPPLKSIDEGVVVYAPLIREGDSEKMEEGDGGWCRSREAY